MQKKSAGSENLIGVGGSIKDGAAKIWGQLVVGLLSNFKNRILGGWLSLPNSGESTVHTKGNRQLNDIPTGDRSRKQTMATSGWQ